MESRTPLVSCIMPTYNRRKFVAKALEYFVAQDYPNKELIIVDDGTDSVEDLVPVSEMMRYVRLNSRATVGAKRNIACEHARGEIIAHWDDDDWHARHRLRYQVNSLIESDVDLTGINTLLFYDIRTGESWMYEYPTTERRWLSGSSLCYRRRFWEKNKFADINVGEDGRFVWRGDPRKMLVLRDHSFHVGIIHEKNVSPKQTNGRYWTRYKNEEVQRILGDDMFSYSHELEARHGVRELESRTRDIPERNIDMMTVARQADLSFDEFAAFNHGQSLPWMRRWELPFVLIQARLEDTMSVLDCTINPVSFRERLEKLYPHLLYRHWNPLQNKQFIPPMGVPDAAFDRVFCVNTLEHLLESQRERLIEALGHKLKPGGLLVLTCDYYFDSFWEQEPFLRIGVMRPDRREVLDGWNKVTPKEWIEMCGKHNLHPMGSHIQEPLETDATLYRNQQPYPHACVAGVFFKPPRPAARAGKKVVLSLLTWNTRGASIDSARAHLREARMLRRVGLDPLLCFCDNGSTDGTAGDLRLLKGEIDVPNEMIFNHQNVGSSIARNQIIDCAREHGADYVLFMDGDIEIVPFSSFAMIRYLESNGHQLGCIGADSGWQTSDRSRAAKFLYSVRDFSVGSTNLVAWTQYGMFRREVFDAGIRFDEREPFNGAGWGFEDNDLAFQMEMKGFHNHRFTGMMYLHREARSSVRILRQHGVDVRNIFLQRRDYVIGKWASVPSINNGPLTLIRRFNWVP